MLRAYRRVVVTHDFAAGAPAQSPYLVEFSPSTRAHHPGSMHARVSAPPIEVSNSGKREPWPELSTVRGFPLSSTRGTSKADRVRR